MVSVLLDPRESSLRVPLVQPWAERLGSVGRGNYSTRHYASERPPTTIPPPTHPPPLVPPPVSPGVSPLAFPSPRLLSCFLSFIFTRFISVHCRTNKGRFRAVSPPSRLRCLAPLLAASCLPCVHPSPLTMSENAAGTSSSGAAGPPPANRVRTCLCSSFLGLPRTSGIPAGTSTRSAL